MQIVTQTERLQLRHLALDDAPFILELVNDPSWIQFIDDRGIRTLAQAEEYLQNGPMASYAEHGFGLFLVQIQEMISLAEDQPDVMLFQQAGKGSIA
jgi:[ribosomal protein S5]-alanine N-acetyltransferase